VRRASVENEPWINGRSRRLVDEATCETAELQLWEHVIDGQREHELVMNGVFLMASYNRNSSEELVRTLLERLNGKRNVSVLIGGLGMGFSAREACRDANVARVDIVEISPVIVAWNRGTLVEHNGRCLADKRVNVIVEDLYSFVSRTGETYDVIAMDIDNGPALLVREENQRVYSPGFFTRVKAILARGGAFAVWSCSKDAGLEEAGRQVFPICEMETVLEQHNERRFTYFLYIYWNTEDCKWKGCGYQRRK